MGGTYRAVIALAWAWTLSVCPQTARASFISYDASSGLLPVDPPFRYVDTAYLYGSAVTPSISAGIASLGPTSTLGRSFWYTDVLTLNHLAGVEISARLRLDSESSSDPTDDSGLAITLTDDRDLYQDLFISPTDVFFGKLNAAGTGVTRDTSYALDTTQWHNYTIDLLGNTVALGVDGSSQISSSLFDIAPTGQLVFPDFVTLGDVAVDASSQFEMTSFSVLVVPEPSYTSADALAAAIVIAVLSFASRPIRPI